MQNLVLKFTEFDSNPFHIIGELPDDLPEMSEDEDEEDEEKSMEATMAGVQGQDSFEVTNSLMSSHVSNMPESSSDAKHK